MLKKFALLMLTFAMLAFCPLGRAQDQEPTIDSTIALLELHPQHHVLDIGFGGGVSLSRLPCYPGSRLSESHRHESALLVSNYCWTLSARRRPLEFGGSHFSASCDVADWRQ